MTVNKHEPWMTGPSHGADELPDGALHMESHGERTNSGTAGGRSVGKAAAVAAAVATRASTNTASRHEPGIEKALPAIGDLRRCVWPSKRPRRRRGVFVASPAYYTHVFTSSKKKKTTSPTVPALSPTAVLIRLLGASLPGADGTGCFHLDMKVAILRRISHCYSTSPTERQRARLCLFGTPDDASTSICAPATRTHPLCFPRFGTIVSTGLTAGPPGANRGMSVRRRP